MAFTKRASGAIRSEVLHIPKDNGWQYYNTSQIKVAGIDKIKDNDLGGFDLKAAVKEHPDHLFVKAFAIKADEVNDNGDAFCAEELKKAAETFIDVPVFVNHQNDDVEKARGKVVHSWWDKDEQGIYIISRVDKEAYPQLARGIEENYITGTSMGAQVGHSVCSICHNKAHVASDFCSHIKERKGKKYSGSHKCNFHKSLGAPNENCPVCGCKKGESKEIDHKEAQTFEWNYDINFIEDSFVVNPACHDCLVCEVLNTPEIEKTSEEMLGKLRKAASTITEAIESGKIEKTAGLKEVNALNEAMNLMESVTRSMMAQKQMVSMEYVSDIVEQLAKLQGTTDELVEMGYAQLQSPPDAEAIFGNSQEASPIQDGAEQVSDPNAMQSANPQMGANMPSGVSTSPAGDGIGTVTKPTFSSSEKEFLKIAMKMNESIRRLACGVDADRQLIASRRESVFKSDDTYSATSGDRKIIITKNEAGECHVAEFKGKDLLRLVNIDALDEELRTLVSKQPEEAARRILAMKTNSNPNDNQKTAAGTGVTEEQTEVITQKQLDKADLPKYTKRWDTDFYETITEGDDQLAGQSRYHDVTTDTPQTRLGSYSVITQAQLDEITDGYLVRWKNFPEVITEKQWDEMSRSVGAILPDDWTEEITQAQLLNLRDTHRWEYPGVITQGQLDSQGETMPHGDATSRWKGASNNNAITLIKASTSAVASAIADYGLSPADVVNATNAIMVTPHTQLKAARLTLLNAVPCKIEARTAERERRSYFERVAERRSSSFDKIDGLLGAMADNIGNLNADKMVDAVRRIVSDKTAFARVEKSARLAIKEAQSIKTSNNYNDDFSNALNRFLDDEAMTKVCGTLEEAGVSSNQDNTETIKNILTFARSKAGDDSILISVSVDSETGVFEALLKDVEAATEQELANFKEANLSNFGDKKAKPFGNKDEDDKDDTDDKDDDTDDKDDKDDDSDTEDKPGFLARSENRQQMIREAQLMGGQMPTDLGAGGGGGASLPSPPGEMGAPVQSFDGGDPMADMGGGGFDEDLLPKPPGSHCPVCTSDDVDVVAGKAKCSNCGSEFLIKVSLDVTKWAGLNDDEGESELGGDVELGGEEGEEGEGFALPESEGLEESVPVAAETRLTQNALKKIADAGLQLGTVSPYSGGTDTTYMGKTADGASEFLCYDSGQRYLVRTAQKGDNLYARWEWAPRFDLPCESCGRVRKIFAKSLDQKGVTSLQKFRNMDIRNRGKLILAMQDEGIFKRVKTAAKKSSVADTFREIYAFGPGDKFPIESCREKLARRFGDDAIALSGPCHGENLADCVCKSLKSSGSYSNGLAIKVAELWSERDGCVYCLEDHIRAGFSAEDSSLICEGMKQVFAQSVDLFADELGGDMGNLEPGGDDFGGDDFGGDEGGDIFDEGVSPFDDGAEDAGFVSIELPIDVLEQIDEALDVALGEDPALEVDNDIGALPEGDIEVDISGDAMNEFDGAAEDAIDSAVDVVDDVAEDVGEIFEGGEKSDGSGGEDFENGGEEHEEHRRHKKHEIGDETEPVFAESQEEKKESAPQNSNTVEADSGGEEVMKEAFDLGQNLKRGKITHTGEINLDLEGIFASLSKEAQSNLVQRNVQDDPDIQPTSNESKSRMGHEPSLDLEDPDAPSAGTGATMGKESDDLVPTNNTNVPNGGGEMGHESEQGYTAEKGDQHTGGEEGAGTSKATANSHQSVRTSDMVSDLAENLFRTAEDKKMAPPEPWEKDKDIQPVQKNEDHPDSGNVIKPRESGDDPEVPEQGNTSFMGHEEESIGDVPKSPDHHPEFPAGGGMNPKFDRNEKNTPEKQEKDKGTVIAGRDEESLAARRKAAQTLSVRMLEAGIIGPETLFSKVAEIERYAVEQISDLEKSIFGGASRKGLNAVAQGSQTPLVINANSNGSDASTELKSRLQSLFSLDRVNRLADDHDDTQLRRYRY